MTSPRPAIRSATPADLPDILRLIRELAAHEREPDAVQGGLPELTAVLFPDDGTPTAFCHVAEVDVDERPRVVGLALWYLTFSTWTTRNGMWLEDLYVELSVMNGGTCLTGDLQRRACT